MKKLRKPFFVILFICYGFIANSQEYINSGMHRLDSLKHVIKTATSDTSEINLLNLLAQQYIDLNFLSSGDSAAREALQKADQLHYPKYKGDSYNKIGLVHITRNEIDSAKAYFIKALEEDKRSKNRYNYIKHLGNIGICYVIQLNYNQALNCHKSALHNLISIYRFIGFCNTNHFTIIHGINISSSSLIPVSIGKFYVWVNRNFCRFNERCFISIQSQFKYYSFYFTTI